MLEEANCLLLDKLIDHVAQDGAHGVKALVRLADICQAGVVQQDLLHDEDSDGLAELGARLHDAQAQRYYLGRQQEVDDIVRIVLDQRSDHAQRGQTEVFEGTRLRCRVEEGVQEQRDVGYVCVSKPHLRRTYCAAYH